SSGDGGNAGGTRKGLCTRRFVVRRDNPCRAMAAAGSGRRARRVLRSPRFSRLLQSAWGEGRGDVQHERAQQSRFRVERRALELGRCAAGVLGLWKRKVVAG